MRQNSRKHQKTTWIYGKHAVKHALQNTNRRIFRIVVLESCRDFLGECGKLPIKPDFVDKSFFLSTFGEDTAHQGCAVLAKKLPEYAIEDLIKDACDARPFIFLDQVTDPQNIGSIMRAAAVLGGRAVVTTKCNSPELTATISKASSGGVEIVPLIKVVNLTHTINNLKKHNFWCVGLDEEADKKICDLSLDGKFIFVIGSEGNGIRKLTKETCDFLVRLPHFSNFKTLNAAQAATISLYENLRQKTMRQ